jgi:hypothetical protein
VWNSEIRLLYSYYISFRLDSKHNNDLNRFIRIWPTVDSKYQFRVFPTFLLNFKITILFTLFFSRSAWVRKSANKISFSIFDEKRFHSKLQHSGLYSRINIESENSFFDNKYNNNKTHTYTCIYEYIYVSCAVYSYNNNNNNNKSAENDVSCRHIGLTSLSSE